MFADHSNQHVLEQLDQLVESYHQLVEQDATHGLTWMERLHASNLVAVVREIRLELYQRGHIPERPLWALAIPLTMGADLQRFHGNLRSAHAFSVTPSLTSLR